MRMYRKRKAEHESFIKNKYKMPTYTVRIFRIQFLELFGCV